MSKFSKHLLITLFITAICTFSVPTLTIASNNATAPRRTIMLGTLMSISNPCTTDPCLPGIIMAITNRRSPIYLLTIDGGWIWNGSFEWKGIHFDEHDFVLLIGEENYDEIEIKHIIKLWERR